MKLKTTDLQSAVTRVYKGVGNNGLIPITSLINVLVSEGSLFLTATDSVNYFTVRLDNVDGEDFEVSVNADLFTKLVQKITSENISIEATDKFLMVIGNGKYKLDLLLDETGNPVKFPDMSTDEPVTTGTIARSTVQTVIANNKASLSTTPDIPFLMHYYCADRIITTDRFKICQTELKMFDKPYLIDSTVMELLATFTSEYIDYYIDEKGFSFDSPNEFLYAPFVEGVDKMPIEAIDNLLGSEINSKCTLPKTALMSVLDRLSLFVNKYDKNGVYLTFNADGLSVTSKKSSGSEVIPYVSTENFTEYTCCIDIEMLKSQLASVTKDNVDLYYGSEIAIKFVDDNITKIVALLEDDRVN